ncbi:MAG: hypothetical protein GY866_07015 [Proteobacteria bacterium]|nr:hypothetical protein [Pseudomonadota bacterium]
MKKLDLKTKISILEQIYAIYDVFASGLDTACRKGCADCCTRNVAMTSLEGHRIIADLQSKERRDVLDKLHRETENQRFQPRITTNELADLCANGDPVPEEQSDPSWGACPLLHDDQCPIYDERPFECRSFLSNVNCGEKGYAVMDPFVVTVNNVFKQYIEHIDDQGVTGNLIDVLLSLDSNHNGSLVSNRPMKVLIVQPEHQADIQPILHSIKNIRVS